MFTLGELESVIPLVRAGVSPTPQYAWPLLEAQTGVEVVIKHENHTPIGAFKVRGGIVYFDRLKRTTAGARNCYSDARQPWPVARLHWRTRRHFRHDRG